MRLGSMAIALTVLTPDGGWRYSAQAGVDAFENDTSVSLFAVMALTSARSARFKIPEAVFSRFTEWLKSVTDEAGIVGYRKKGDRADHPRTLTAGALFLEEMLGLAAPIRDRQAEAILADITNDGAERNGLLRFYAALAFRVRGEKILDRYCAGIVTAQSADGAWSAAKDEHARFGGDAFMTALNILTLTSPYRFSGS